MNEVVQLGPLALASDRLLAVGLIMGFVMALERIMARTRGDYAGVAALAVGAGIVAARLVYVAQHHDAYASDPYSILAVWQGGFSAPAGLLAAAIVIAWRLRPRRAMGQALGALAVAGVLWFTGSALLRPEPRPLPGLPPMTMIDGRPFDMENMAGRPMVINLWATWCPPCRRELPMLADIASSSTVPVILVNQGEPAEVVRNHMLGRGIPTDAILLDSGADLAQRVAAGGLPTTLFVDGQGRIVETHVGEISRAGLLTGISELEAR
ncbi:prolipoprotein diacylglyceryl transferase family protein [Novosphingobium sp. M1R2S20]|uniref:Prolipoprotein diacylglyceryl transferase family protein n=1 Tax=Novosphingobium rhizovicinum TaxID=3228928 RepID=A0ABV3REA2_9SPHN